MESLRKSVDRAIRGELSQFYQATQGIALEKFDDLIEKQKRGEARQILRVIEPAVNAMHLMRDTLPGLNIPSMHILRRQARKPPKRRKGHSKRWPPR